MTYSEEQMDRQGKVLRQTNWSQDCTQSPITPVRRLGAMFGLDIPNISPSHASGFILSKCPKVNNTAKKNCKDFSESKLSEHLFFSVALDGFCSY